MGTKTVKKYATGAMTIIGLAALGAALAFASSTLPVKIILGTVGGIVLFAVIYKNPFIGIVLFLVFNLTLPQAGPSLALGLQMGVVGETRGLHFNIHEIIMAMVLVAWLIRVFLKQSSWRESSPLIIPILLYVLTSILACFVGILNGGSYLLAAFRFIRTTFFAYIFFVFLNNIKTRKQIQHVVVVFMICATLVALFGLVQKVLGQAWTENFAQRVFAKLGYPEEVNYVAGESEGQAYRVNSSFLHPNVLGAYLVLVLPFFVSLFWCYRKGLHRLLLVTGLGIVVACLFFTGSRAAWIAAAMIALIYCIFGFFDKRMVLCLVTLILLVSIVVGIIYPPDFVKKRFVSLSAKEAAKIRVYQYSLALDFFMEHPLFGLGMGMEGKRIRVNNVTQMWAAVENAYLTYLVSHGLVGFSAFILLFIVYWIMLLLVRSNARSDPFLKYYSEALFLGIVGIAVASLFGAWLLFGIGMVTMFWSVFGIAGSLYNVASREGYLGEKKRKKQLFSSEAAGFQH